MTLRRLPLSEKQEPGASATQSIPSQPFELGMRRKGARLLQGMSMRGRLAALTAIVVITSIAIITLAAYSTVNAVMYQELDRTLKVQAQAQLDESEDGESYNDRPGFGDDDAPVFRDETANLKVMVVPSEKSGSDTEDSVYEGIIGPEVLDVLHGDRPFAFETYYSYRMYALRDADSNVIVLAQSTAMTKSTLDSLALVLFLLAITGAVGALITGLAVASAGVQPINRLRSAVERVTATGELRQIPVRTQDELGDLTVSYNGMMSALQSAETKQKNLVADASHELKTPLTSLRTNIELLMQVANPDPQKIDPKEVSSLKSDVIGQIDEMSTLIGDLVDLAREDSFTADETQSTIYLEEVFETVLERVQRRRMDVTFKMELIPWQLEGNQFALTRALMNLMDNAAKWSPQDGAVRVWMEEVVSHNGSHNGSKKNDQKSGANTSQSSHTVEIRIADSGPGIPEEDREKVFDRFYRSIKARSMPGSGLGLAIAKQNIEKHHGLVVADESDDGGTLIRILLPGTPHKNGSES